MKAEKKTGKKAKGASMATRKGNGDGGGKHSVTVGGSDDDADSGRQTGRRGIACGNTSETNDAGDGRKWE